MVTMTFDEYDSLIKSYEAIQKKVPPLWPSLKQIDMFGKDIDKWLMFAVYLLEMNPEPKNRQERYSRANLLAFVNTHLKLTEPPGHEPRTTSSDEACKSL